MSNVPEQSLITVDREIKVSSSSDTCGSESSKKLRKRQTTFLEDSPPKKPRVTPSKPTWLCFDLNGSLCSLTENRYKGILRLRPGCRELQKLKNAGFFLCVWSSSSKKTVTHVVNMLRKQCSMEFDKILFRDHCKLVDGGPGTIKPLVERGHFDLRRVFLIDDSREKGAPGEERNLLLIPPWQDNDDDAVIPHLVRLLLDPYKVNKKETLLLVVEDVRKHKNAIEKQLFADIDGHK